jgi:hypothetical protein
MQNLFLLPTEKPSRLTKINDELFFGKNEREMLSEPSLNIVAQHIYITSDEEIKDVRTHNGKWQLEKGQILNKFPDYLTDLSECKLVILTTDQDLIADGVQAIDDEFLEWFVKNPSCEFVKITKDKIRQDKEFNDISHCNIYEYKISIPQKEPKRKIDTCYNFDMEIGCVQDICRCEQEEPKQETLTYTEAAKKEERIFNSTMMSKQETLEEAAANLADPNLCKTDNWIAGANWMAERMYSEEDMREAFKANYTPFSATNIGDVEQDFQKWFEQFKKK